MKKGFFHRDRLPKSYKQCRSHRCHIGPSRLIANPITFREYNQPAGSGASPTMASAAIRSIKNVTKGYSAVQVKVRNGLCNLEAHLGVTMLTLTSDEQRHMGPDGSGYGRNCEHDFQQVCSNE